MATEVRIPKLGMTMTTGTLADWRVPDGAHVEAGTIVFHLETEKIDFEVEAEATGVVRHTVPAGTTLPPGSVVGYILSPGEALPAPAPMAAPAAAATASAGNAAVPAARTAAGEGGRVLASPAARRLAMELGVELAAVVGTGPGGRVTEADVAAAQRTPGPAPAATPQAPARINASPIAVALAEKLAIDLAAVAGTGPGGRITKEDVEGAAAAGIAAKPAAQVTASAPASGAGDVIPMRGMRKVIAERMHASLQEMAQLTLGMEAQMDEAVKLRAALIDEWADEGLRPGYTDMVIKAVAKGLRLHPRLNAVVTAQGIELLAGIHIGMAVAVENGLVVPVIRDADRASLRDIAAESTRLAGLARDGKLGPDDMAGGTFSVTALGMAGVDFFTPVINPPNVAILGVGRIRDAVRWEGDRPVRCSQMTLSLTIDHRAVDGAPAAAFLQTVRDLLQSPYRLLL